MGTGELVLQIVSSETGLTVIEFDDFGAGIFTHIILSTALAKSSLSPKFPQIYKFRQIGQNREINLVKSAIFVTAYISGHTISRMKGKLASGKKLIESP